MNRRTFIESLGANCKNWTWSWAFVNHEERVVIFGAWDKDTEGDTAVILDEKWQRNAKGRRKPAYGEAIEYLQLVSEGGYQLKTFAMTYSDRLLDKTGTGRSEIGDFHTELTARTLSKVGQTWYATSDRGNIRFPNELDESGKYAEGAAKRIVVNSYERNGAARTACIRHYGPICIVCRFNFKTFYGAIAEGMIHVHHIVPLASIGEEYVLDPVKDLRPICPNCHAVIHRTTPPLAVEELKTLLAARGDA